MAASAPGSREADTRKFSELRVHLSLSARHGSTGCRQWLLSECGISVGPRKADSVRCPDITTVSVT